MFAFALLLFAAPAQVEPVSIPDEAVILKTLRAEHPRLIALPADLQRTKKVIAEDPRAAELFKALEAQADKYLTEDPVRHRLIGPRLLDQSRKCLGRVYTLATVYRLTGDRRYAERALKEMLAAAAFNDWNPSHFLDTAEMTHALGIGYDWLYADLPPADRETIRRAIVEKGLREAEQVYRKQRWWSRSNYNWNQVCNGGIALGALAVAEDEPQLAAYLVHQAVNSVQLAMREFAPDGAWGEGPGYWNYATSYNVYLLAGLESALGTDFALSRLPGFSVTGDFRIHAIGPTRQAFNFADGGSGAGKAPQMFWLARKFNTSLYAWHEREHIGGASALDLWWFDSRGAPPADFPTDRWFRHVDVVMMRSQWNDPRAVYVGFKAGDNRVNHSHLDVGSFVLDAEGQRWAIDLGGDDYNLPAYFGNKRWTYYRLGTVGHNTLLFDQKNQNPKAAAPIVAFLSTPPWAHAVADLTAAYQQQARRVQRGMALLDRRQVLVQDEIEGAAGAEIAWQVHTRAKIELDGDRAALSQRGEKLLARILSPPGARFTTESANPPRPEAQQPDVTKLVVKLPGSDAAVRLAILLTPGAGQAAAEPPKLVPLSEWAK
jgi:hypothetical protein